MSRDVEPQWKRPLRAPKLRGRKSAAWHKSQQWCFDRAKGRCEVGVEGCTGRAEHAHHMRLRSQGGSDDPSNLLAVCHLCHDWIHRNRDEAKARGWIRHAEAS